MIWKNKKIAYEGDKVTVKRFAWLPVRLSNGDLIFFEKYNCIYEYQYIVLDWCLLTNIVTKSTHDWVLISKIK